MSAMLKIKVTAKARHNRIQCWLEDSLKIGVTTAAEKGKANDAVLKLLARQLAIPVSTIRIVSGHSNPHKVLALEGIQTDEMHERISKLLK